MSKVNDENGSHIKMEPVYSGSVENDSFFKWTPFGHFDFGTVNPAAAGQLELGKDTILI